MPKLILQGKEAQEAVIRGINKVADAVGSTLGAKASNVLITKKWDIPDVTHDGVTVAKNISLKDPFEDAGAQLLLQAASRTNDIAGDGTTTATVLARAIVNEGKKAIDTGANVQMVKDDLLEASKQVLKRLDELKIPISTNEELEYVATISSASTELGKIVTDAVLKAGKDGVVNINEVPSDELTIEHKEGMEFDRGYISPYFVIDDKNRAGVNDAYILLTDRRISATQELIPFVESVPGEIKNLVVISEDVDGEALAFMVMNKLKGHFNALAVRAPAFGSTQKQMLEDIASITGASVISEDTGRSLASVNLQDLGRAEKVVSDIGSTMIIGGKGEAHVKEARIKYLKTELEETKDLFQKDVIAKRIAKLSSGVVVINVGGKTESEMRERKYRVEDAVNATRAAQADGIVAGGETALLKASRVLENQENAKVLLQALKQPFLTLLDNAGITDGELIAQGLRAEGNMGINVMTGELSDLMKDGVIDPVKVTKTALENAVSIAALALTTRCVIVDDPEEIKNA